MSQGYASAASDTQDVITVLTWLGFVISTKEQVSLVPKQQQVWCGALICTLTMRFLLPPAKLQKTQQVCRKTLRDLSQGKRLSLRQKGDKELQATLDRY
eukprot:COSAG02_NODE_1149_length_14210_cov_40.850542_12_plen_99_part_00